MVTRARTIERCAGPEAASSLARGFSSRRVNRPTACAAWSVLRILGPRIGHREVALATTEGRKVFTPTYGGSSTSASKANRAPAFPQRHSIDKETQRFLKGTKKRTQEMRQPIRLRQIAPWAVRGPPAKFDKPVKPLLQIHWTLHEAVLP